MRLISKTCAFFVLQVVKVKKKFYDANILNKNMGMFYVASLSLLLLASTVAIPLQASAEIPDTTKIPVIIQFNDKVSNQHKSLVKSHGGEITRTFTIINGVAANLPQNAIDALEKNPSVVVIDLDLEVQAFETQANGIIGATAVQNPPISKTGNNVRVAILDTGIMLDHPEFAGKDIICKSVFSADPEACEDGHGHGTHVAGIVGGLGINPAAKGVAPNVDFYIYKVLNDSGSGSFSGIIAAIDQVVKDDNSEVISMSLGLTNRGYYDKSSSDCNNIFTTIRDAIKAAKDSGITVVTAAGNDAKRGVAIPGCYSYNIAVAATDDFDNIASFSSIGGPVEDHGISAPGVSIYSSVPSTGASCCSDPNMYKKLSGTSMATPMVAGSIALLLEQNSSLSPDDIQTKLFDTAVDLGSSGSDSSYGHGRINILAAVNSVSSIDPLPSITIDDATPQDEGDSETKTFDFKITRTGDLTNPSSVTVQTNDGSATLADNDYVEVTSTLVTFGSGNGEQTISVTVNGDTNSESDETFTVDLSNCSGCTFSGDQGVGTITNDDGAALPTVSIEDVDIVEGDGGSTNLVFTITRSGDDSGTIYVNFATGDDNPLSADAGTDYAITSGLATLQAGATSVQFSVPIFGDTIAESNETFVVTLSNCLDCDIFDGEGIGTINDDDGESDVTITFVQYNARKDTLRVKATSTDFNDILTVYTSNNHPGTPTNPTTWLTCDPDWGKNASDCILNNKGSGTYDRRITGVDISSPYWIKVESSSGSSHIILLG